MSYFTQSFYLQNLNNVSQQEDDKGRNQLVFRVATDKVIRIPVLRAAKLVWIYSALKYLKEEKGLSGFIHSDWFASDSLLTTEKALGVSMVNFLLQSTGMNLQLAISKEPRESEADLLSDWFAGWCNASRTRTDVPEMTSRFDALIDRHGSKIDWIRFACRLEVQVDTSAG